MFKYKIRQRVSLILFFNNDGKRVFFRFYLLFFTIHCYYFYKNVMIIKQKNIWFHCLFCPSTNYIHKSNIVKINSSPDVWQYLVERYPVF